MKHVLEILKCATIYCLIGSAIGWYLGNAGGFRRGVMLTSQMVLDILNTKEDASITIKPPSKYTDL